MPATGALVIEALKKNWTELSKEPPGRRFQNRHRRQEHRGSSTSRTLKLALAIVLLAAGAVLLLIPGPGSLLILIGAALLAEESLIVAKFMDRTEVRIRKGIDAVRTRWKQRGH
jgi:hypothetical protein